MDVAFADLLETPAIYQKVCITVPNASRANVLQGFGEEFHFFHRAHADPAPFATEVFPLLDHDVLFFHRFAVVAFNAVNIEHHEAGDRRNIGEF